MSHYVMCQYCDKKFDRDKEEFVKISEKRFAHKLCSDENNGRLTKEAQQRIELENYIKKLLHQDFINPKVRNQLREYIDVYHYTYSGMLKSLQYFYEIKKNNTEKMNQGIGIIPYCYEDARKYFYAIFLAQTKNIDKDIDEYKLKANQTDGIIIPPPQREPIRSNKFSFLEGDELIE